MGIETEFGVTCTFHGHRRLSPDEVARYLFRRVVSWGRSSNVFLRNGARLYLDVGSHPEYATAECDDLLQLVEHDHAGERVLEDLLIDAEQRLADDDTTIEQSVKVCNQNQAADQVTLADVALDDPEPAARHRLGQVLAEAAVEIVDHQDLGGATVEELVHERRADRTRPAGHEDSAAVDHRPSPCQLRAALHAEEAPRVRNGRLASNLRRQRPSSVSCQRTTVTTNALPARRTSSRTRRSTATTARRRCCATCIVSSSRTSR